jgi:hypothetical protein
LLAEFPAPADALRFDRLDWTEVGDEGCVVDEDVLAVVVAVVVAA